MSPDASTLMRLSGRALLAFLGGAPRFEARAVPGFVMALSNEPVADLNYLMLSESARPALAAFEDAVTSCDERGLPFAAMLGPAATAAAQAACRRLSLVHAVDWPLMVCPAERAASQPVAGVAVRRVATAEDAEASNAVLAEAFRMPLEAARRCLPLATMLVPGLAVHVAECEGRVESTVTVTRHGAVAGVWAMGTRPEAQGRSIGRALLSEVMARESREGAEHFFLGATPAGRPLYDRLGFSEVASAEVWVRGETAQA